MEKQRVNMDISKKLWKQVGIRAAIEGIQRRELVELALKKYMESKGEMEK